MAEDNTAPAPRTGDTIVIGADGTATNIDQEARDRLAAEQAKAALRQAQDKPVDSKAKKTPDAPAPDGETN